MFIGGDDDRFALLLGDGHRRDLASQVSSQLGGHSVGLAAQGHAVLGFALDAEVGGHVFGRFGHAVHAVQLFHAPIDEAPAQGGVVHRVAAAEGGLGLGHHKRRAAHAFHAAGNHQLRFTAADGAGCTAHRVHATSAQAVDGGARYFWRQAGQQGGHAGHVAVVFAGLVGAAIEHIADGGPVHARVARHQCLDGNRTQVVGAHRRERAAVAADGRADGVADVGLAHGFSGLGMARRRSHGLTR